MANRIPGKWRARLGSEKGEVPHSIEVQINQKLLDLHAALGRLTNVSVSTLRGYELGINLCYQITRRIDGVTEVASISFTVFPPTESTNPGIRANSVSVSDIKFNSLWKRVL